MNIKTYKLNRSAKKVGLFCNARDEKNIKEWAAHHLLIGFDLIVIFDHKSKIPLSYVFSRFDKRVIVIRFEKEGGNVKVLLMNRAAEIARKIELDWFIYLDADEFLILNGKFKGVKHFLNTYSYGDLLGVNWLMFGSNYLIKEPDGLILENYQRSAKLLDKHIKSFVRPNEIKSCSNPHFYHIKTPLKMIDTHFNLLKPPYWCNSNTIPFYNAPAYIAHYVYQSEETYLKRKINLSADDGTTRQNMGKEIHSYWNEGINTQPQKYVGQIKEFLRVQNF